MERISPFLWQPSNMKRRISVRARSQSLSFLQVSLSKRRTLRKQSLPLTTSCIASPSPSVLTDVGGSSSSASLEEDICLYSSDNDSDTCQSGDESSYMKHQLIIGLKFAIRCCMLLWNVGFRLPSLLVSYARSLQMSHAWSVCSRQFIC